MKLILHIIIISITVSCNGNKQPGQIVESTNAGRQDTTVIKKTGKGTNPDAGISQFNDFKVYKIYALTDTITADLNGDGISDLAYFKNTGEQKRIFIVDGQSRKEIPVGTDSSFHDMGKDFTWVDLWGTTADKETYEVVIKDDEIVDDRKAKLENTSIFVRKEETGGGVITFLDNNYKWIHQSD